MMRNTILLADDEPAHAKLIELAIGRVNGNCRLDVVSNGTEVIDYLFATGSFIDRDPQKVPNLILLNLKMPKMGALQVLQVLQRVRTDSLNILPPVVILTSSASEVDMVEAYRLGARSFIRKPIDFSQLVEVMQQIVRYWLDLNQSPSSNRLNQRWCNSRTLQCQNSGI